MLPDNITFTDVGNWHNAEYTLKYYVWSVFALHHNRVYLNVLKRAKNRSSSGKPPHYRPLHPRLKIGPKSTPRWALNPCGLLQRRRRSNQPLLASPLPRQPRCICSAASRSDAGSEFDVLIRESSHVCVSTNDKHLRSLAISPLLFWAED